MSRRDDDLRRGRSSMAPEDKAVLAIGAVILAAVILGLMVGLRGILSLFGMAGDQIDAGLGLREGFIIGLVISFFFMVVFALAAGDGVVGELGMMLVGFFVMLAFFTLSIAIIF